MEGRRLMPPTPCLEHRCPQPAVHRGRCQIHKRTTTQRGYGPEHQAARRALALTLPMPCAYGCGTMLVHGDDWVAAHVVDGDPSSARVVSCRRCNERAKGGAALGAALRPSSLTRSALGEKDL